jgi:hypothetical protein
MEGRSAEAVTRVHSPLMDPYRSLGHVLALVEQMADISGDTTNFGLDAQLAPPMGFRGTLSHCLGSFGIIRPRIDEVSVDLGVQLGRLLLVQRPLGDVQRAGHIAAVQLRPRDEGDDLVRIPR